jgi:hypothetical protein
MQLSLVAVAVGKVAQQIMAVKLVEIRYLNKC